MRAAIYNPYLDTLGGGERYTLAFALALNKIGYDVFLEWKNPSIKKTLEDRFGMQMPKVGIIKDIKRGEGYDLCFWVSDGSIPLLKARKNILHFQIPFMNVDGRSLLNKMKLFRVNKVVCNSNFTKKIIDKEYGVSSSVLYPPVDTINILPKRKKNIILAVGRFSQLTQAKNQDILIKAFRKLTEKGLKDWKLVLAGGAEIGAKEYIVKLKRTIGKLPVEIIQSPTFKELKGLYGVSKIYWSASGYGKDPLKDPKAVEHFGISVVEAMSAGAVPLAFNAGGHTETVKNSENGFLWNKINELNKLSMELITNPQKLKEMSKTAELTAKNFSYDVFNSSVNSLVS